jgi:hypothetical protein
MQRREFVGVAAAGAAAATAGCLGALTGSEAVEREASQAKVASATVNETDYELKDTYQKTVTRTFDTPVGEREAKAINEIAEYHRTVQLGTETIEAAVFAALATPAFEFGDETFNPVDDMSNKEIAKMVQGQYEGLSVGSKVDERDVSTLSGSLTLSKFQGSGTVEGNDVPVYIHVGKIKHQKDFVVPLAVYPQQFAGEADTVVTLVENLTH